MNQREVIEFARLYLYGPTKYPDVEYLLPMHQARKDRYCRLHPNDEKVPLAALSLNRSLQYYLCQWYERFNGYFDEVTRKDVAQAVEAWIFANEGLKAFTYSSGSDPNYVSGG